MSDSNDSFNLVSSDSESDKDLDKNSDKDADNTIIDVNKIRYFKPDQLSLIYNGYIYTHIVKNENGTSRWRCISCNGCALITKGDLIVREPKKDGIHIPKICQQKVEAIYGFGSDTIIKIRRSY